MGAVLGVVALGHSWSELDDLADPLILYWVALARRPLDFLYSWRFGSGPSLRWSEEVEA